MGVLSKFTHGILRLLRMLTWPSIIGCALARIYDLLRRVFLGDLELLFGVVDLLEFLLALTDGDTLGG